MTDRAAPKAKKAKGDKDTKKVPGPKLVAADIKPGIGHNSGAVIPELVKLVDELLHIGEQKKALGKAERDLRNKAKTEFGVLSGPLAHEMRLRKMDSDVRVQFESSHADLKKALGYQPELDFVNGATPTNASLKAQPSEAELAGEEHGEEHGEDAGEDAGEEGFTVEDEAQEETNEHGTDNGLPVGRGGVITREG